MQKKSIIVAFCGIDGVGKTTLFNWLSSIGSEDMQFITRGPSVNEDLVASRYPRQYHHERDWIETDFGNAIAVACALDYTSYWKTSVEPLVQQEKIIFTDRYATCFQALCLAMTKPEMLGFNLLQTIKPPDLTVFIVASWKIVRERIEAKKSNNEFESAFCQSQFLHGYKELFRSRHDLNVITIDNTSDISIAKRKLLQEINLLLEKNGMQGIHAEI